MNTLTPSTTGRNERRVVSHREWLAERQKLLAKEKELTKFRDEVSRLRQELPWVRVEKNYEFDTEEGKKSLSDLFDGRDRLIVYHMMYAPGWEEGCPGCSFVSDHVDGARQHFEHKGISYVAVSRAPLKDFLPFKKRMGWTFRWVSSNGSDFNYDFGASFKREDLDRGPVFYNFVDQKLRSEEQPGLSVFAKDSEGRIYHTYSSYERGLDLLLGAYNFIDLTPEGRNEESPMEWVRFHDAYEDAG